MSKKIKVAVVGVGNCASALIQGVHYYRGNREENIQGIGYANIGGYFPEDIEFVAAFDVDKRKIGLTLSDAIFAKPNCCRIFSPSILVDKSGDFDCKVMMGPVLDGVSEFMSLQRGDDPNYFDVANEPPVNVAEVLRDTGAEILLNYLPVGSEEATQFYANAAIESKVMFINCIPVLSLNEKEWEDKFIEAELAYVGSDMKSAIGASVISQVMQELLFDRGAKVDMHAQINMGFNNDFANMEIKSRLADKKISKENVIRSQNDIRNVPVNTGELYAGPAAYIPRGTDEKVAFFDIRATGFGGAPYKIDIRLSVQDSENSAGVVIDAIRFLTVAKELGVKGCLRGVSAWTQKSPPVQLTYAEAKEECEALSKRKLTERLAKQI
nr:MAG: myo-inositol-1-phosphate synthase [Caudoviricetes sp.]